MKRTFTLISIFFLLTFAWKTTLAQGYAPFNSPDVIIHDDPNQNQQQICCKASGNGLLYAVYTVDDGSGNIRWEIRRSTDHGNSWFLINYTTLATNWKIVSIDLVVIGNTSADIRLFVATQMLNNINEHSEMKVAKYDRDGSLLKTLCDYIVNSPQSFLDVSLASDFNYPATGSNPFSIGVLYSKTSAQNGAKDSIVLLTSSDGGNSLNGRKLVTISSSYVRNVSLAYGHSHTKNQGQYYAAWEIRESGTSDLGQIWTAHTYPYFNSDFTAPIRVDDYLEVPEYAYCSHPVIKCQYNNTDNNDGSLSEVLLFDRATGGNTLDYDIVGVFNKDAPGSSSWKATWVDVSTLTSTMEPDLCFDASKNNFIATYFDVNNNKLRAMSQGMNFPAQYNWDLITDQYNDDPNLVYPFPRVDADLTGNQLAFAWIASRTVTEGEAMFDGETNTVGIGEHVFSSEAGFSIYPNPASSEATVSFTLDRPMEVIIGIYSPDGRKMMEAVNQCFDKGSHAVRVNMASLKEGIYLCRVSAGDKILSKKITIIRE